MHTRTLSPQEAHERHTQWLMSKGYDRSMADQTARYREQKFPQELARWADPLT